MEENLGVMDNSNLVYSGKKESIVIAVDPVTGKTLASFDETGENRKDNFIPNINNGVFLTRTQYTYRIILT